MRKFLFVLASTGCLATVNAAIAQYPATELRPLEMTPLDTRPWLHGPWIHGPWLHVGEPGLNEERRTNPQLRETYENQRTPITRSGANPLA